MRALHGLITFMAAIVVVTFAGSWVAERYELGWELGLFGVGKSAGIDAVYSYKKVPATGPDKLSVSANPLFGGPGWIFGENTIAPLPVRLGPPQIWGSDYDGHSQIGTASEHSGGGCRTPTVNIIEQDDETGAGSPLFDHRVFIPRYAYYEDGAVRRMFALVVDEDTDGDGFLTCWDNAKIEFHSLHEGATLILERIFTPVDLSHIHFDLQKKELVFLERTETDNAIKLTSLKISFDGEIISEETTPDLLSKAKAAFERTGSD